MVENSIIKTASGYGLILGFALVALSFLEYLLGISLNLTFFVFIGGIAYCTVSYRNKYLGGYISYKRSVYFGVLISGFAYIILGVYMYLYSQFINPAGYQQFLGVFKDIMIERGLASDQVQDPMTNPIVVTVGYLLTGLFMGLIISLITSIFTKKE